MSKTAITTHQEKRQQMLSKATRDALDMAHKLGLPFLVYPAMVTQADHQSLRMISHPDHKTKGESLKAPQISGSRFGPGELFADLDLDGKIRIWTHSLWNSPIVVYQREWDWATKQFAAAKKVVQARFPDPTTAERFEALVTFQVHKQTCVSSPVGLTVLMTKIEWSKDLVFEPPSP